jgi:hypothetical protein
MSRPNRKPTGRTINPTFFVFCEGRTEELYVNYLKSKYRLPIFIDAKTAGNRITEKCINSYKRDKVIHPKDKTYLMYDLDAPKMLEKLQAISNTILLSSNPCFELWFLLLYQEQTTEISTKKCIDSLKSHHNTYKKEVLDEILRSILNSKQEKALHRAAKLAKYKNPSARFLLIQDLEEVQRSK